MNDSVSPAGVVAELAGLIDRLAGLPGAVDDAERIDRIAALEKLKAAVYAAQVGEQVDFDASQQAANQARGLRGERARRGIAEQIGLARGLSPASAARQLTHARVLSRDMPQTLALLRRGEVSEFVATLVVNETSHLGADERRAVDAQLAGELAGLGPKKAAGMARRLAIEADPAAAVARASNARKDRRVSLRPAPDTMTILTALVPVEQGVKAYASLRRHADAAVSSGDERSRHQIMADELIARVSGQADAVSAEIGLVMTDTSLLGGDETPAEIPGYGPVPAQIARNLAAQAAHTAHARANDGDPHVDDGDPRANGDGVGDGVGEGDGVERARIWIRRLYTDPATGIVRDCDPRRRRFDGVLAKLLHYRDGGVCRDPYCDADIREYDHVHPYADGGDTIPANGRGVCQRGNHTRQIPGWNVRVVDAQRHIVDTTTPTGHTYRSAPPRAPGKRRRAGRRNRADNRAGP
ncbi:HNH endonuclease signature motif containing protein [Phytoactinopolyspora halotolerans]|uniref:DUF222 domain-containing protein n=1 Tax=Phytoactinopolyspora halotolerans TaxID=1981512 RepID=A0A6L9S551_9ACTN|nr:HNH endonuclease signature motif containing protein [Phytoactinopolyspora halotolerans]NED99179.1 DUF222 domain-containing protein [Phytoactinopolyspora halotolerans]